MFTPSALELKKLCKNDVRSNLKQDHTVMQCRRQGRFFLAEFGMLAARHYLVEIAEACRREADASQSGFLLGIIFIAVQKSIELLRRHSLDLFLDFSAISSVIGFASARSLASVLTDKFC